MRKYLIKKLCLIKDRDFHCEIMDDLDTLQLSKISIIFKIATNLLLKKVERSRKIHWIFLKPMVRIKNGWYEGLEMHAQSTKNSLEAINRVIINEDTLRERISLSRFTVILFLIVKKWSKKQNPASVNSKKFEHQIIKLGRWIDLGKTKQICYFCSKCWRNNILFTC